MTHLLVLAALSVPHLDSHGDPLPPGAIARFGTVRFRTGARFFQSTLSPDGRTLAVENRAGITLWDVETGRPRLRIHHQGQSASSSGPPISSDGKLLARKVGRSIEILDTANGSLRRTLRLETDVISASFVPATDRLAVVSDGGNLVTVYDVVRGGKLSTFETEEVVWHLLPPGQYFIGLNDSTPSLVDAATGKVFRRFPADGHPHIANLAMTADGRVLFDNYLPTRLRVLAADSGALIDSVEEPWGERHHPGNAGLSLSPDGKVAYLSASGLPTLRRDFKARKWLPPLPRMPGERLFPLPDGKRVLLHDDEGLLRRYDLATLKEIPPPEGFVQRVRAEGSPDGRRVAVLGFSAAGNCLQVFETTGRLLWAVEPSPHGNVRWSPDGRHLACVGPDRVTFLDAVTGRPSRMVNCPADGLPLDVAFDRDGKHLFVMLLGEGLAAFDLTTNMQTSLHEVPWQADWGLAPGGRVLLYDPERGVSLFEPKIGGNVVDWTEEGVERVNSGPPRPICTPDQQSVLSWNWSGTTYVRDPATLAVRRQFSIGWPGSGYSAATSPNGLWLAIGTDDGRLTLWDIASGEWLGRWDGHCGAVTGVSFAGVGRAVTTSTDLTALLWELRPKDKPALPVWHALAGPWAADAYRAVWAVAADPNGPEILRRYIKPAAWPSAEKVRQWLADLGADKYPVREAATKELQSLGRLVEADLKAARGRTTSAEVRTRLDALLAKISPERTPTELVHARAVAAMEIAGTPAARKLLAEWAAGAPGARLTIDAKAALARLAGP